MRGERVSFPSPLKSLPNAPPDRALPLPLTAGLTTPPLCPSVTPLYKTHHEGGPGGLTLPRSCDHLPRTTGLVRPPRSTGLSCSLGSRGWAAPLAERASQFSFPHFDSPCLADESCIIPLLSVCVSKTPLVWFVRHLNSPRAGYTSVITSYMNTYVHKSICP